MIPARGLALGTTLTAVSLIVLIPLAAIVITAAGDSPAHVLGAAFSPRALAAYRVTGVCALIASAIDVVAGGFIAFVLVRYPSGGMKVLDALVDVPFAIPTAVTGITLATLYGPHGWVGTLLATHGIAIAYTPAGIVLALAFVGLPFVVRTVQPIVATLPQSFDEAAASLGATPFTIARRITLPLLTPGLLTGFRACARAHARRVRIGDFHRRQHAVPYRDRSAHHRNAPRRIRLLGRRRSGRRVSLVSFVMLLAINTLQRRLSAQRSSA